MKMTEEKADRSSACGSASWQTVAEHGAAGYYAFE